MSDPPGRHRLTMPKAAAFLLVLALSVLVNTGAIAIPNPWLATVVSFLSIFVLPGFLLSDLVFGQRGISWPARLPVAFVLALGLLSPLAVALVAVQANLEALGWVSVTVNVVLSGLFIFRRSKRAKVATARREASGDRLNPFLLAGFLFSFLGVVYVFLSTASTWSFGDNWSYLLHIRRYLDLPLTTAVTSFAGGEGVSVRGSLNGWWVLQALMDRAAAVEPVDVYSIYLPPLLLIVSLLALYGLAEELFKRRNAALLVTLIQVVYCLSSVGSHDWIGRGFFDRIIEDKFLIWLILLPVTILFSLKYLSTRKGKLLIPLALGMVALGLTHPMGVVQWGISLTSFAVVHLLFNLKRGVIIRFGAIFVLVLFFLLIPLVQRQMMAAQATSGAAFEYAAGTEGQFALSRTRLWVFSATDNRYMAHPQLIAHPLTVLAILLTPLLIQYLRQDVAAQFLFSNMVIPLLVLYNPVTAPPLGKVITPWMLWRVSWVLPVSLTVGFFLCKIAPWIQHTLMRYPFFASRPLLLQVIPLLTVILVALPLQGHVADGLSLLRERRAKTMSQQERDLLVRLRQHTSPDGTVMAEPAINTHIPAFVSAARVLTFRGAADPSTTEDVYRFYRARLVTDPILDTLERQDARYVIIARSHDLAFQLCLLPARFIRLYENAEYQLYKVLPGREPHHVVTGNTYLVQGEWERAIAEYETALMLDPDDTLAHFGLGQAHQGQGRPEEAKAAYRQAIAACPDNIMARLALAELCAAEGKIEEAINQYQAAVELRPDYLASFEAWGDLYRERGDLDGALGQYKKAIDFPPDTADYHLALGDLYWAKGLSERAIAEYKAAITSDSGLGRAVSGKEFALTGERNPTLDPRLERAVSVYLKLGDAHLAHSRLDDAVAAYQQAVALDPDTELGHARLGSVYLSEGLTEQVIALYRDAVRRNLNLAWPHIELGKIYLDREPTRASDETN